LNYRCSSAVFQSKDDKDAAAVQALVELCLRRRAAAPTGEDRPLLLCVVSREGTIKDDVKIERGAQECAGLVNVDDLDRDDTAAFVQHCLQTRRFNASPRPSATAFSLAASRRSSIKRVPGRPGAFPQAIPKKPTLQAVGAEISVISQVAAALTGAGVSQDMDVLAEYVFELTGGNPLGVLTLLQELESQQVLEPRASDLAKLTLTAACQNVDWLRSSVKPPQSLVAMAFSVFERLDP
jgi:hypothetical protein